LLRVMSRIVFLLAVVLARLTFFGPEHLGYRLVSTNHPGAYTRPKVHVGGVAQLGEHHSSATTCLARGRRLRVTACNGEVAGSSPAVLHHKPAPTTEYWGRAGVAWLSG